MDEIVIDPAAWSKFGLAGLVIGAMFWLILHLLSLHREERREWKDLLKGQNIDLLNCKKETNAILRELSSVMNDANRRHRSDD